MGSGKPLDKQYFTDLCTMVSKFVKAEDTTTDDQYRFFVCGYGDFRSIRGSDIQSCTS